MEQARASAKTKIPVAFFSLEMGAQQLIQRMICSEGNFDLFKYRKAEYTSVETAKAEQEIMSLPIFIDDTSGLTPLELRSKARKLQAKHNIGFVIVDYIQLMDAGIKRDSREQEISYISRSLKALAKELNIPVMVLAQLNRNVEARAVKRPSLADLRESGSIEQDADLVMFIHRPEQYGEKLEDGSDSNGVACLTLAKHRNGATGNVDVKFFKEKGRFGNYINMPEFVTASEIGKQINKEAF